MAYTALDRYLEKALGLDGAAGVWGPPDDATTIPNLGSVTLADAALEKGTVLSPSGLIGGAAAAVHDGGDDYTDLNWPTRTNYVRTPNPDTELGTWTGSGGFWNNSATVTRDTTDVVPPLGLPACTKIVTPGSLEVEGGRVTVDVIKGPNKVSLYVRGKSGGEKIRIGVGNGTVGFATLSPTVTSGFLRYDFNYTATASGEATIGITGGFQKVAQTIYVAAVVMEVGSTLGDYFPLPAELTSGLAGWSGTAYKSASDIGPFVRGSSRTFAGVAMRDTTADWQALVSGIGSATPTDIYLMAGGDVRIYPDGGTSALWSGAWPGDDVAVHWAIVFNDVANEATLYIDGVSKGTKSLTATYGTGQTTSMWIGRLLPGSLLPFSVFTRALSRSEIEELWRQVNGTFSRIAVRRQFEDDDRHCVIVRAPDGTPLSRWAEDEPNPANVLSDLKLSGTMPGGKKELRGDLGRNPRWHWPDIAGFLEIECQQPGRSRIWHGRIGKAPRSEGDKMVIRGEAVGYAAALEDRRALRLGFIERVLGRLQEMPAETREALIKAGSDLTAVSSSIDPFGSGETGNAPAGLSFTHSALKAGKVEWGEMQLDSGVENLAAILFDFEGRSESPDADFTNVVDLSRDGVSTHVAGTDLNATTALQQATSTTIDGMRYARFISAYAGAGLIDPFTEMFRFANIVALANHGLPTQGTWPNIYLTAAQILRYAIPEFSGLEATEESVEDDGVPIYEAWYPDPGTLAKIVDDLEKTSTMDWFVKDAKLFERRVPGTYGRRWQVAQGLDEADVDAERAWDRIVVAYQDPDGTTRHVGYPGSGADVESASLQITDPDHPAVRAGEPREDLLVIPSISVAARAVEAGERWLRDANELPRSGTATLEGHIEDDRSVPRPVGQLAEGDLVSFLGSSDSSYRKVVDYDYDATSRKVVVRVDAPSESVKALLELYRAALIPLGLAR